MYETFGFSIAANGDHQLTLFVPDNAIDAGQYGRGGPSHIAQCAVIGDFLPGVQAGTAMWDTRHAVPMARGQNAHGHVFTYAFDRPLPDGYYQYQYVVTFDNRQVRVVGDPCTKYGGDLWDRSAFVVGGSEVDPEPIADRLPAADLRIYELMLDDFTREYRGALPAIDAVIPKLDDLASLNVNAIEFMPWIAWPDDTAFSWGYDPAYFFSVESAYVDAPGEPLDRLSRLGELITACHRRGLHVLLDIVLQHARQGANTNGFPYYWLWQDPTDSPFVGRFTDAPTYGMLPLDYDNACTQQFVTDVCMYWLKRFRLDGFRFDQVTGYDNPRFPQDGAPRLIADLRKLTAAEQIDNVSLILEDAWDFSVIQDANTMQPSGAWFDVFRSYPFDVFSGYAVKGHVDSRYLRVLNAAVDFDAPVTPTIYIENHDHATVTHVLGSRDRWFKAQPYMIALATCPGTVLLHNGQEWGQVEDLWEDDSNAPPQNKRVQSRPLRWTECADAIGQTLRSRYAFLMQLRAARPGLRSPNFYPDYYDTDWTSFSPDGYGIDEARQVIVYHRWGPDGQGGVERFMVVLNFGDATQWVDVPLPTNGNWLDLLNGNASFTTLDWRLPACPIPSNWGRILWQRTP